jgi:hypothetical protein
MMTEGPSRPRDANQLAKRIVDLATGAETEEKTAPLTPAQEFARSGGLKGGAARAASNRDDPIKQRIFQQPARARLRRLDELPISQRLIREAHQRLMTGVTTDRGAHIEPGQFSSTRQLLKHPLPHSAFGPAHEAMTNAFSKKVENHVHMVALHFMAYNFTRIHGTLRCSPAMAAGVIDRLFDVADIVTVAEEWEARRAIFDQTT